MRITLGISCLEIIDNDFANNTSELIPAHRISGVFPVTMQTRLPDDEDWTHPYDTITRIKIYICDGNTFLIDLQSVTNQPGWNGGTLDDIKQAVSDISDWIASFDVTPFAMFSVNGTTPLEALIGLNYQEGSGPSPDSTPFFLVADGLSPAAGNITIVPLNANFEMFSPADSLYHSSTFTVPYTGGSINLGGFKVRLKAGLVHNPYIGSFTIAAPAARAPGYVLALSGTVTEIPFSMFTSDGVNPLPAISGLKYEETFGPSADSAPFILKASGLIPASGNIVVTLSNANFELFNPNLSVYTSGPVNVPYVGGASNIAGVKIRLKAGLAHANYACTVTIAAPGAPAYVMNVSGVVAVSMFSVDTVFPIGNITGLNYQQNSGPSADSLLFSLVVFGTNTPTGNVTITPSNANFELFSPTDSLYHSTPFTVPFVGSAVTLGGFRVRLKAGLAVNSYAGTFTVSAPGITPYVMSVSGAVSAVPAAIFTIDGTNPLNNLADLDYEEDSGPSAESVLFALKAVALSPAAGNITVTPSGTNFEILNPATATYTSTAFTLPYTGSAFNLNGFKVRTKSGLAPGAKAGTFTISAPGAPAFILTCNGTVTANTSFTLIIKTDNPGVSTANQFRLALRTGSVYNATIRWGDGTSTNQLTDVSPTHTYAAPGTYVVKVSGTFPSVYFNYAGDGPKITSIRKFGNIAWNTFENAFAGCYNMNGSYNDAPNLAGVTSLRKMFDGCYMFNWPVPFNTATITDMFAMFGDCYVFNQSVNGFVMTNVTNTSYMFVNNFAFNQPVNTWNVVALQDASFMFYGAKVFNQSLSSWQTTALVTANSMFQGATAFNQDMGTFKVSLVNSLVDFMTGKTPADYSPGFLDGIFNGWTNRALLPSVTANFGTIKRTAASTPSRNLMIKASQIIGISNCVNNGAGLIRVTISSPVGGSSLLTGDKVFIYGVVGSIVINGAWNVTVIGTTTIDLNFSTFSGTYTSGGQMRLGYGWTITDGGI